MAPLHQCRAHQDQTVNIIMNALPAIQQTHSDVVGPLWLRNTKTYLVNKSTVAITEPPLSVFIDSLIGIQ